MGAELWYHEIRGFADPGSALKAIQAHLLNEQYNLSTYLPQHLAWARETVSVTEAENDPYGLLDEYRERVRLLENPRRRPIPDDSESRLEIVRQVEAHSGQGIGSILDVIHISDQRGMDIAQNLSESEILRLVGTVRPTLPQAHQSVDRINNELGRGECVCFPYYDEGDQASPAGWFFVGNTID